MYCYGKAYVYVHPHSSLSFLTSLPPNLPSYLFLFKADHDPSMTDTAGLRFILSTPAQAQALDKDDRKAIRSHATRAGRAGQAGQKTVQLRSWLSPDGELGSLEGARPEEAPTPGSTLSVRLPSPRRVGAAFSGLQLPSGVEPYMVQDLVKCIHSPLTLSLTCLSNGTIDRQTYHHGI